MKRIILTLFLSYALSPMLFAQQKMVLPIDSLFSLTVANSKQLDVARYKINLAEKATSIEKQEANLPNIETGFSYAYLSNAGVWNNHFQYEETVPMPHTSLDFSVEASYLVFDGNASKNRIQKASLEEQVARLNYDQAKEDVQFLLLAKYLDLAALYNQENVVIENITLAKRRLKDIGKLIEQGMLTHNDRVRSELLLTELQQKLAEIRNNITMVNHELTVVTGLPQETRIVPDSTILSQDIQTASLDSYRAGAAERLPELQAVQVEQQISKKQESIVKSKRLPTLSVFAGDALSRPFIYSIPPQDIYLHLFQAGVKVHYDISSLYRSKRQVQQAKMQSTMVNKHKQLLAEKAEIGIHTAYVKLQDAQEKYTTAQESYRLAKDNYQVVEQKYLNKFAVITDIVDASNALLAAQINMNNTRIGIIYQYYYLMKAAGLWSNVNPTES